MIFSQDNMSFPKTTPFEYLLTPPFRRVPNKYNCVSAETYMPISSEGKLYQWGHQQCVELEVYDSVGGVEK